MRYLKRKLMVLLLAGLVLGILFVGAVYADSVWQHANPPDPNAMDMANMDMGAMSMEALPAVHQPMTHLAPLANGAVELINTTFVPFTVTIRVGETVTWTRQNGFHNVSADDGSFRLGEPPNGAPGGSWITASHTFTQAGTFRYHCEIHGGLNGFGMSGVVVVQAGSPQDKNNYLPFVMK